MIKKVNKNLIIQLARFGDLIQTARLIRTLEQEGEVHIALAQNLLQIAALLYPSAILHPVAAHATGALTPASVLQANAAAFHTLAAQNFTHIYNLNNSPMSVAIAAMFDAAQVRGYAMHKGQIRDNVWIRATRRISQDRTSSPLNLVDFWAFFHDAPIAAEAVNPLARPKRSMKEGQRIGVVMSGREARRSLPPEYLAHVLEAVFTARKGPELILLGSAAEGESAKRLCKLLRPAMLSKVINLCGKTDMAELYHTVAELDLVLTPDTGIMHLAAHLGVPVMAFFLSSALAYETGPYGLGHMVWQSLQPCSPCLESAPCPHGVKCLEPFASADWLAHLTGKNTGGWPKGMCGLVSCFDALGLSFFCVDGEAGDAASTRRLARRALLGEYLGLVTAEQHMQEIDSAEAAAVFQDRDWVL